MISYKHTTICSAALCATLFLCLLFTPNLVYWLFQVPEGDSASFAYRRAAMLFLGLATIAWLSKDAPHSDARQAICLGFTVLMFTLAISGIAEFARGYAGVGVLVAVAAESAFGMLYLGVWTRHRQT